MRLSEIGELSLLEQIRKRFEKQSANIVVGIGDDAAVLKPVDKNLLVTTDMMVEGVHFDLSFITPYQLGFKLISVNVSDIYAMGGIPVYLLLDIAVNKDINMTFIDRLFDGVTDAINLYNTILIGGDLSSTNAGMTLSATLIGYAKRYIRRSGADIGDRIYVTGNLGDSACGLELLKRIKKPVPIPPTHPSPSPPPYPPPISGGGQRRGGFYYRGEGEGGVVSRDSELRTLNLRLSELGLSWNVAEPLLRRHLMPVARDPKKFIRHATAMIDISDGLLIDLSRLCDESKVGARIYIKDIPVSSELKKAASYLGISPIKLALSGGEDYELLFTVPPDKKVKAICIGEIIKSERVIIDKSGKETAFAPEGYQHFGIHG
ncbi:MAG: thiamine-monophosphate kinase [Nitrospirae bacterium]|nr:thiamine-monophosphate kinase [Nitrospirota bacterium]